MKHFLIYTNRHKDKGMAMTGRIRQYLEERGQRCTVIVKEEGEGLEDAIPQDAYCMIVLGGDGTMLQAAWDAKKLHIPLIGVNMGTLGYMTEIEADGLTDALDKLMEGSFETESRMMLNGRIYGREGGFQEDWALNDVVISRSGPLQIIKLNIYVNGQFLYDYSADGMIVTTPTGSTGYNLSAGGPIVEPRARLILLTPICPHSLNARSIVLSAQDVIQVEVPPGRDGGEQLVEANFDGAHTVQMRTGDRIRIAVSEKTTEIIQINRVSFLEVLRRKMSER